MKKSFLKSFVAFVLVSLFMPLSLFADAVVSAPAASIQAPEWIVTMLHGLMAIPAIGHILVGIVGVLATASPILTGLSAILMALEKGLSLSGLVPEINFLNQKLIPWVAMFSNLNVQSPTSKNPTDVSVSVLAPTAAPSADAPKT